MNRQDLRLVLYFFHQNNCMRGILKIWKYASRCLCFYPEIVVISALVSEACLWEVIVNVETITGTENKATVKCLALDGTSREPLPRPREHCGRLNEKNVRARGWGGVMWSIVFRTWHECFTCEHIAAVLTCTRCQHPTYNGIGLMRHTLILILILISYGQLIVAGKEEPLSSVV